MKIGSVEHMSYQVLPFLKELKHLANHFGSLTLGGPTPLSAKACLSDSEGTK
ncbi:MAG: hypothetical protein ACREYC_19450 [Gammaproteobacteria bacterium]